MKNPIVRILVFILALPVVAVLAIFAAFAFLPATFGLVIFVWVKFLFEAGKNSREIRRRVEEFKKDSN